MSLHLPTAATGPGPTSISVPASPANARLPHTYESAKIALANCVKVDECKDWADKAAALASYAKQANDDELMKQATRIRDRAIRRAGELLKQIEPQQGANQNIGVGDHPKVETRKEIASSAGMSPHQAKQAIRVANVPDHDFEKQVESDKPPTISQLAVQGIKRPPPQPIVDFKGRDPNEFNRALHFVGEFELIARNLAKLDIGATLPILIQPERDRLRTAISKIDAINDTIVTRI